MMGVDHGEPKVESAGRGRRLRRFYGAEDRVRFLALFERSGQSAPEFCRQHGVGQSSLNAWRRGRGLPEGAEARSRLVKVGVSGAGMNGSPELPNTRVLIRLSAGRQIEVAAGTDVSWLAALAQRLDACSG